MTTRRTAYENRKLIQRLFAEERYDYHAELSAAVEAWIEARETARAEGTVAAEMQVTKTWENVTRTWARNGNTEPPTYEQLRGFLARQAA